MNGEGGEYLIEFVAIGQTVKATAIDPVTGIEASAIGPASAGQQTLAKLAAKKLDYLLNKLAKKAKNADTDGEGGGGLLV